MAPSRLLVMPPFDFPATLDPQRPFNKFKEKICIFIFLWQLLLIVGVKSKDFELGFFKTFIWSCFEMSQKYNFGKKNTIPFVAGRMQAYKIRLSNACFTSKMWKRVFAVDSSTSRSLREASSKSNKRENNFLNLPSKMIRDFYLLHIFTEGN